MPSIRISKDFTSGIYYLLSLFGDGNGNYEFWAKTNMPKVIKTEKYLLQKIQYIHANPVRKHNFEIPIHQVTNLSEPAMSNIGNDGFASLHPSYTS